MQPVFLQPYGESAAIEREREIVTLAQRLLKEMEDYITLGDIENALHTHGIYRTLKEKSFKEINSLISELSEEEQQRVVELWKKDCAEIEVQVKRIDLKISLL